MSMQGSPETQIFDYMENYNTACVGVLKFNDTCEPIYRVNGEYTVKVTGNSKAIVDKFWSIFCDRLRDYYQDCSIDLMPKDPVENVIIRLRNW